MSLQTPKPPSSPFNRLPRSALRRWNTGDRINAQRLNAIQEHLAQLSHVHGSYERVPQQSGSAVRECRIRRAVNEVGQADGAEQTAFFNDNGPFLVVWRPVFANGDWSMATDDIFIYAPSNVNIQYFLTDPDHGPVQQKFTGAFFEPHFYYTRLQRGNTLLFGAGMRLTYEPADSELCSMMPL